MKIKALVIVMLTSLFVLESCENSSVQTETNTPVDSTISDAKSNTTVAGDTLISGALKLYPLTDSPLFNDAILDLNSPGESETIKNNVVNFNYEIKNYELAKPTTQGCCATNCANSNKGQHIHLILNNEPYQAKYSTSFSDSLKDGHYIALSFLSRSYHESIKHYEAYDLRQFTVGKTELPNADLTKPLLFYSRPKGEYKGAETKKVLLDFYVVNANLSASDYKVRATVNGTAFTLTSWKAYLIEGLPMGESTFKIELLDRDGQIVNSEFNSVERKITLSE
jgi:hypothetical protein